MLKTSVLYKRSCIMNFHLNVQSVCCLFSICLLAAPVISSALSPFSPLIYREIDQLDARIWSSYSRVSSRHTLRAPSRKNVLEIKATLISTSPSNVWRHVISLPTERFKLFNGPAATCSRIRASSRWHFSWEETKYALGEIRKNIRGRIMPVFKEIWREKERGTAKKERKKDDWSWVICLYLEGPWRRFAACISIFLSK